MEVETVQVQPSAGSNCISLEAITDNKHMGIKLSQNSQATSSYRKRIMITSLSKRKGDPDGLYGPMSHRSQNERETHINKMSGTSGDSNCISLKLLQITTVRQSHHRQKTVRA